MIVSCPSCGTSYKHRAVSLGTRARCGCCASTIDLTGLKPYRIERSSLGLDEPALATRTAAHVAEAPPAPLAPLAGLAATWDETEPLPEIPEMSGVTTLIERPVEELDEAEMAIAASAPEPGSRWALFGFWAAGGAIVGTGTSWTLGGTTVTGLAAGAASGLAAAWAWLRWTSRP